MRIAYDPKILVRKAGSRGILKPTTLSPAYTAYLVLVISPTPLMLPLSPRRCLLEKPLLHLGCQAIMGSNASYPEDVPDT
jgi:hypothetical protein